MARYDIRSVVIDLELTVTLDLLTPVPVHFYRCSCSTSHHIYPLSLEGRRRCHHHRLSLTNGVADATFVMVRMGTATHSINSDQRRVPLTNVQRTGTGRYTVRLPNDSGILLPGPWYLFAMSKEGVPSVARTVYVQR